VFLDYCKNRSWLCVGDQGIRDNCLHWHIDEMF
jgi:hypothetical protein